MVAPFLDEKLLWDFRLERVKSINASGHKYGLVFPGVGWIIWRDRRRSPTSSSSTSTIWAGNADVRPQLLRPGAQVVAQYFNFLRLGRPDIARSTRPARKWPSIWPDKSASSAPSSW